MTLRLLVILAIACALSCKAQASPARSRPDAPASTAIMHVDLTKLPATGGQPAAMSVRYAFRRPQGSPGVLQLRFDTLEPSLVRTVDQVDHLQVSDAQGAVPMATPVRTTTADGTFQVWTARRPAIGEVRVSYQVPAALPKPVKRGPHVDLQAAGGGLSGAFVSFMLMPDWTRPVDVTLKWHLHPEETAVSTFGVGDVRQVMTLSKLAQGVFLAGRLQQPELRDAAPGFSVYALGMPGRQLQAIGRWAGQAYEVERHAFAVTSSQPYFFLIRSYDGGGQDSGRSTERAFMLYLPQGFDTSDRALHSLVAHEMVHSLIKSLDDEPADGGLWYTEGLADYFSLTLPATRGLYTPGEFIDLLNQFSATYYTNALRATPDAKILSVMWSGRNAWEVPYSRGFMYFATLDAQLQRHGASLAVLDLVNETSRRIGAGAPAVGATWEAVLRDKLGAWALAQWRDMMGGAIQFPAPDAFGRCVVGHRVEVGFFDLGFKNPVRLDAGGTISGLSVDSNAYQAGLRDGDVLARSVDIYPLFMHLDTPAVLPITRAGKPLTIRFDPHAGRHAGMRWSPSPGESEKHCHDTKSGAGTASGSLPE